MGSHTEPCKLQGLDWKLAKVQGKHIGSMLLRYPWKYLYIYILYCFCIQHSGQYVYSICLVYFQFANSRNLNDWGMNMEVGNSAFATVSHGCHFQTQMARKTLGSFCQLFSSDFGSDCCGNGSAESQVDKNKSSYKHSRADLIFQRNLRILRGNCHLNLCLWFCACLYQKGMQWPQSGFCMIL